LFKDYHIEHKNIYLYIFGPHFISAIIGNCLLASIYTVFWDIMALIYNWPNSPPSRKGENSSILRKVQRSQ